MKRYVRNSSTKAVEKALVRRLCEADAAEILRVSESVTEQKRRLYANTACPQSELLNQCEVYGLFADSRLVGVGSIRKASSPQDAADLDAISCDADAYILGDTLVHADYEQNGIERELAEVCARRALYDRGASALLAFAAPADFERVCELLRVYGFRIKALRLTSRGKLYYFLLNKRGDMRLYSTFEKFQKEDTYSISKAFCENFEGIAAYSTNNTDYFWLAR